MINPFGGNRILIAAMGLLLLLCRPAPAPAEEARLTDVVVTKNRTDLLVYLRVADCFTEDMKEAIDNGIDTTFTFFVRLYRVHRFWLDEELADIRVNHTIRFDSFKKEYRITLSEREDQTISVTDFEQAKNLMSEIVCLQVAKLRNLHEGERYRVSMMAELDKIRLPLYLHYVLFFLSLWDFETDWYTVDFTY
jgi:hypothetical protein